MVDDYLNLLFEQKKDEHQILYYQLSIEHKQLHNYIIFQDHPAYITLNTRALRKIIILYVPPF